MARKGPSDSNDDDKRIWARVTGTVTPPARRKAARVTPGAVLPDPESPPVVASKYAYVLDLVVESDNEGH